MSLLCRDPHTCDLELKKSMPIWTGHSTPGRYCEFSAGYSDSHTRLPDVRVDLDQVKVRDTTAREVTSSKTGAHA